MSVFCLLLAAVLPSFPTLRQEKLNFALQASPIGSSISELALRDPLDGQVPGDQKAPKETERGGTLSSVDQQVEGIEHLAELWSINDLKVKKEVTTCLKNTKGDKGVTVIGEEKDRFDITCKEGSVITIGIKKKGKVTVQELSQALKKLPEVEGLFLDSSNIWGQIADLDLSQHHRLKRIQMRWCVIEGELKDLRLSVKLLGKGGKGLKALRLSGKGVRGSLSDLKHWKGLHFLDLRQTSVTGNLSTDLGKPEALEGLWLPDTDVTGDITDLLKRAKKLKYLDLMGSKKVYGKIGSDWTGGDTLGQYVTELMIGKTNVGFDVPEILARERRFFPNLTIVSVKGSKLAMDVWKFLYPFSSIRFLKKVDASGCDLSGAVHTLYGESADGYSGYAWRLEHLELANNKITGLLGNPGPKNCMLDARGNPLTEIDPSYFQNLMLLDIRNTNYTISESEDPWEDDAQELDPPFYGTGPVSEACEVLEEKEGSRKPRFATSCISFVVKK